MLARLSRVIIAAAALWGTVPGPSEASFIRMNIVPSADLTERFVSVSVALTNEGDEPAFQVRARVEAGSRSVMLSGPDRLNPGERQVLTLPGLPVGWMQPGAYHAVVRVEYQDGNGYPFSALAMAPVVRWERPLTPFSVSVDPGEVSGTGSIRVRVRSLDRRVQTIHVRLLAPGDLGVRPESIQLVLDPQATREVTFGLDGERALPGSAYAVYVLSESEQQGRHLSISAPGTVRVVAPARSPRLVAAAVMGVGLLPLALLALFRLRSLRPIRMKAVFARKAIPDRSEAS